jgi:hypothetical protein
VVAHSKIVNEEEVKQWIREGRTFPWMVETYRTKYNLEVSAGMFSNRRRQWGMAPKQLQNDELLPWRLNKEHTHEYPALMLRFEARRRAGKPLREQDRRAVERWVKFLADNDKVVHYDPESEDGFSLVPREADDTDIVRMPEGDTGKKRLAD